MLLNQTLEEIQKQRQEKFWAWIKAHFKAFQESTPQNAMEADRAWLQWQSMRKVEELKMMQSVKVENNENEQEAKEKA